MIRPPTSSSLVAAVLYLYLSFVCSLQIVEAQETVWRPVPPAATSGFDRQSARGIVDPVYGDYGASSEEAIEQQQLPVVPNKHYRPSQSFSSSRHRVSRLRPAPFYQLQESQYSLSTKTDAGSASYSILNGQSGPYVSYTSVPKTSFSCKGLPYDYGIYADEETGCQAFHICYNGRKDSFLCGPGTVFNQRILHCDHRYSVECGKSSSYYSSNAYMGSSQPEPGPAQASTIIQGRQQSASSSYNRSNIRPALPPGSFKQSSAFSRIQQVQEAL